MKRIHLNNLSFYIFNFLLVASVFASCKKETATFNQPAEEFVMAKGGPSNSVPEVRLRMTVNTTGISITGDGADYVDGSQNVRLYFSTSGNLQFTNAASNKPSVPVVRWLNVNLNSPLDGYIARGVLQCGFISTITTVTSPNSTPLQSLVIGATKCIGFSAAVPGGVINFHRNSYEDIPNSNSSYVYVTRTGDKTWVMTSVRPVSGGCSDLSGIAAFRNQETLYGYYNIPFSITLTQIP